MVTKNNYLFLMGIDIWLPREQKQSNEALKIEFYRFAFKDTTGVLLFKMEQDEKPFQHKIYRFMEAFLFSLSLQYNRQNLSSINIQEIQDANLIIQFGSLPPIFTEQYNKNSNVIINESCMYYIQNPLQKALLWKSCNHLLIF